ncbi:MAG: hypothetical protein AUJ92_02270 [Armatimonadetes bacterium CG2_30_59_28]|nr:hypothetical protein [Armatimonadota bacterium]OIO98075.1 MAG: hypothetical protein AUJ92_02270 [Armatimonadetes bacterium CG2_30_59_28]PIU67380.1 MAG: hypothetical protein COS85_00960 [Armatimonadetes bacterium CG07_land_8_20_14_0_80_59_28]PIY44199.1 MAG: hypothetical protein COZ05_08900 [Armatimonadetes bacterium CG_4_10_14_3_um_filter_59_10]
MADESSARPEVVSVWEKVKSQTFDHIPFRANVMDAFHAAVPIAIDGDIFVVGFSAAQFHMSGLLRTPDTKNAAESVLRDMAKREIQLEVIEGTTVEEWRSIKERRTISRESQMRDARVRLDNRSTKGSFDSLREELARRHSEVEGRQFPQAKARFLRDVLPLLAETSANVKADPKVNEDTFNRELARTYDRLGSWVDMSASHVALELDRYLAEKSG